MTDLELILGCCGGLVPAVLSQPLGAYEPEASDRVHFEGVHAMLGDALLHLLCLFSVRLRFHHRHAQFHDLAEVESAEC